MTRLVPLILWIDAVVVNEYPDVTENHSSYNQDKVD